MRLGKINMKGAETRWIVWFFSVVVLLYSFKCTLCAFLSRIGTVFQNAIQGGWCIQMETHNTGASNIYPRLSVEPCLFFNIPTVKEQIAEQIEDNWKIGRKTERFIANSWASICKSPSSFIFPISFPHLLLVLPLRLLSPPIGFIMRDFYFFSFFLSRRRLNHSTISPLYIFIKWPL